METSGIGTYEAYARRYNQHLKEGNLGRCGEDLFFMAAKLRGEGRRRDELKALMLSFYFNLNGTGSGPAANRNTARRAKSAVSALSIRLHDMEELYLDTIRRDTVPRPIMSVRDSLSIFEMCLDGRYDEADDAIERFASHSVT